MRKRPTGKNRWRWPGRFNGKAADRAVRFIQSLPHIKGRWAGQRLKLTTWQRQIIEDVFGTLNEDGTRQYRKVYIEIPRKNGKTTLASAVAQYLLFADREPGAEIYSAAYDKEQASIAFDLAVEQIKRTPELDKLCRIIEYRKRIVVPKTASYYRAVEREAIGQHGWNAHGIIFDELHTQKSRDLWDVLTTSTGSRSQPLIFAITTAGFDRTSICYELHDYARKILNGTIEDPAFYPVIYSATSGNGVEAGIDWQDKRLWRKANPALRAGFVSIDEMQSAAAEAQAIPAQQNTFKRLRLNIWTQSETRLIDGGQWKKCAGGRPESELEGLKCYGGLDLASTTDIAACAFAFPVDGRIETVYRFWCPLDSIVRRSREHGVPYESWVERGYMTATPGNAIDFDYIEREILDLAERYDLQGIAYDRWQAVQIAQHLEAENIEMVATGMGFASMSEPTKELLRLVLAAKLRHTDHPVMNWMVDNLMGETDAAENIKPSKKKSTEKIDGPVALILAIDRMIRAREEVTAPSVYEDRGILRPTMMSEEELAAAREEMGIE